jgi:AraC-like DNA-binding protein
MRPIAARRDWASSDKGSEGTAPIVLASAATGIVDFIEGLQGDVDRIFGHAGIAPSMAGSPTLKLRLSAFCNLFEEAARLTGNDNFGLWFGNQFQPRDLGLWGYAAVSSPTLGSALENMVGLFAFHQASSMLRLAWDEDGLMRLEYQIQAPDILERRQDAELSLGMFLNVFRECCGPNWAPEEVHFEHPVPTELREHESAFGAPVYFSQPANALLFRPEVMDRPMPGRDLNLMAMMQTCLQQLSVLPADQASLIGHIRNIIRTKLPNGYPSLEMVAQELRLTPAAVKRELGLEGVVYKDLVEMTRRDLAMMYLKQRQLPFSEIAFLLGYSELSAFSRAVRRWTGESPRTVRTRLTSS